MEYIYKIKKMLCKELEEYADKARLTGGDLEPLWKLTDIIKNLDKIEMLEENDYSEVYYDDGVSYARGRARNAKRDGMGRYSRDMYPMDNNGYSRNYPIHGNYSYEEGKENMLEKLGEAMKGANAEEKKILERAMRDIERA